jgi:hypothetical protein
MTRACTLPSTREQAHQALLLLGAPAPARLVVDVHAALFDGDLDMPSLAALLRREQRRLSSPAHPVPGAAGAGSGTPYQICLGLNADLTAARGLVALATWPVGHRIVTPAVARADALAMVVRVAQFAAVRPGRPAVRLLRQLTATVPGGPEAPDAPALAQAAREALADPALLAAVEAEAPVREAAEVRAAGLDEARRLFGVPAVPQQRSGT